ncbi:MAG: fasciclin domain-containing protein [Litorilinea sp.]
MSKIKTSIAAGKQSLNLVLVAALVVALFGAMKMGTAVLAAPAAQNIQSQEVAGVLTGGQSAQIWLGLNPQTPGENITLVATWDRTNPTSNGVGFYVLTADQTREVVTGASLDNNNLGIGASLSPQSPDNEIGAVFGGTAGPYTIVVFNRSNADASFTLRVDNGVLIDDAGQVRDNLAPAADDEADDEAAADDEAEAVEEEAEEAPAAVATPAPVATTAPAAATETEDEEEVAEETDSTNQAVVGPSGVVRSPVLDGELPEQYDQHFFSFEPHGSDVEVRIVLSFDPQDQPEVARRLNFWVMNASAFRRYIDPSSSSAPGSLALAAGSTSTSLEANQRVAEFRTAGSDPYVVIVYNNSDIPASYNLTAEGGQFVDDSQQSLTAQRGTTAAPAAATDDDAAEDGAATTTTTTTTTTTPATTATTTRTGTPGSTYVVQAGDTLSLIARDVLGDIDAWRDICNLNDLGDCNRIEVGMELQLPTTAQIGTTQAGTPAATTATATTGSATTTTTAADDEDEDMADDADMADDEEMADEDMADEEATDEDAADDEAADDEAAESSVDLVAALRANGSFDTLVEALEAANLTDALVSGGPFTIFAPTDAAFAALPAGAMEQLLNQPMGQLTQILLFHILSGRVGSGDVSDGMQATTHQGKAVRFELDGSDVLINGAAVVVPDLAANNGVIHAIDAVILPPTD